MPKSVFHFGGPEAGLLGTLQTATRLRPRSAAVLLCSPLGEEASRAHRVYRVLATQLERSGYASLRFDYRCAGDSVGEESAATLELWRQDIEQAAAELARRAATARLALAGVRLGATLAAMAAASGRLRVRHLILWDPVVDGASHLQELAAAHAAYLREELGAPRATAAIAESVSFEYLGLALSAAMCQQISAIDLASMQPPAERTTVLRTRSTEALQKLEAAWRDRPGVSFIDVSGGPNWNSDSALNAATVPAEVVRAIVRSIEESSP